ncbi:hypothetical protein SAMN05421595_2801 [Austwickia chelonae]|nr:hypothetical protein [Austwickia chelonae]SEW40420.1 hypothetical protein SAMN05421595_2801 [Austwickia chelonae]
MVQESYGRLMRFCQYIGLISEDPRNKKRDIVQGGILAGIVAAILEVVRR